MALRSSAQGRSEFPADEALLPSLRAEAAPGPQGLHTLLSFNTRQAPGLLGGSARFQGLLCSCALKPPALPGLMWLLSCSAAVPVPGQVGLAK